MNKQVIGTHVAATYVGNENIIIGEGFETELNTLFAAHAGDFVENVKLQTISLESETGAVLAIGRDGDKEFVAALEDLDLESDGTDIVVRYLPNTTWELSEELGN